MQKHVKVYMEHFDYIEQDLIPCEVCMGRAVDIHHIVYRSQGGTDEVRNLMALCRKHHDQAHDEKLKEAELKLIHGYFMTGVRKVFKH
jgi:5-methylcytosine-specific restriction endonuclease McrA